MSARAPWFATALARGAVCVMACAAVSCKDRPVVLAELVQVLERADDVVEELDAPPGDMLSGHNADLSDPALQSLQDVHQRSRAPEILAKDSGCASAFAQTGGTRTRPGQRRSTPRCHFVAPATQSLGR